MMCLSTEERQTTDMDWLNSELYALLAIKIGWQRLEREARVYHRHRVALLTKSVTHPERVLKVTYLLQAFYPWESSLKEFRRGRPAELDEDVKANAMRPMLAERKTGKEGKGDWETGKRWFQRKGMVQRKMVKPWSHVGHCLVSFQWAQENVRS